MQRLKLAASKIPIELMDRLNRLTELTGLTQSAVIRQAIEQFLDNADPTGFTHLTSGEGSFKPSELMARADAVDARLTEIDARLLELERSPPPPSSPKPPPPLTKPLADGGQWLVTKEAWQLSQRRGCRRDYAAFSKFAKAHPDRLGTWGIRHLGSNKSGDQRTASFQDLRFED